MSAPAGTARYETVNSELLTLTYGAMVTQLVRDFGDPKDVNTQLELMGYNIGIRIVDEFCAKTRTPKCRSFRDAMETTARDAFRMFLGVTCALEGWSSDGMSVTLRMTENPLADFVELPPSLSDLRYSSLLAGAVKGALECVSYRCVCVLTRDIAAGEDATEIRVTLKEVLADAAGKDYREE